MKKTFTILAAIAVVCIFEACSKKDNPVPSPVLTGFEGIWTGKYLNGVSNDSLVFTLSTNNFVTGRDVTQNDTLNGIWSINSNKFIMTCYDRSGNNNSYRADFKNDSLKGTWINNPIGFHGDFYLVKKK